MTLQKIKQILFLFIGLIFVGLGSQAPADTSVSAPATEAPLMDITPPAQQDNDNSLTSQEREQLEINEDNVMEPFPG